MELNVGPEKPLPGVGDHATVLTQVHAKNLILTLLPTLGHDS